MWKEFCREREPPKKRPLALGLRAQGPERGLQQQFKNNQNVKLINNKRR